MEKETKFNYHTFLRIYTVGCIPEMILYVYTAVYRSLCIYRQSTSIIFLISRHQGWKTTKVRILIHIFSSSINMDSVVVYIVRGNVSIHCIAELLSLSDWGERRSWTEYFLSLGHIECTEYVLHRPPIPLYLMVATSGPRNAGEGQNIDHSQIVRLLMQCSSYWILCPFSWTPSTLSKL